MAKFKASQSTVYVALARIIRVFCTPGSGKLKSNSTPSKLDSDLYTHFKGVVEILSTDAAADERKAMRLLARGPYGKLHQAAFKNCKATIRYLPATS